MRSRTMRRRAALLLCLGLAACGATQVNLAYAPPSPLTAQPDARPVVAITQVTDRREDGHTDPRWIGAVRDGSGTSVKDLMTPVPVTEEVLQAFASALRARGLLAPDAAAARYGLEVDILALETRQTTRRAATAEFRVTLRPVNGGAPVLVDQEEAAYIGGDLIMPRTGVFSSSRALREITQTAMSAAIDRLLDKPGFTALLQ
ncbi:hypothetical protein QMO56_15610 [Roseomonas sp. E05]|uniref:hypothetical protein n=1 Tax=Roseomonas sp. E05 TaxID=3046310 RepID=UPI0024BB7BE3|nr:hypothetical protein [Roseomonas sp. E05]MDJ0389544.1 hypothetical protein [Roseomonas sp. E05]